MNNFTYDNTKDATHFYSQGYFYINPFSDECKYICKNGEVVENREPTRNNKSTMLELSRPHNETREYWTTNGVTQYAQGNEINTDEMLPISYVKKFTPLVDGDILTYDNEGDPYEFTLNGDIHADLYNEDDEKDKYYSLVLFADRPNTGTQPVGDDVVVDRALNSDDGDDANNVTCKANDSFFCADWSDGDAEFHIKTWKPNHAAMLKQYQTEQSKGATWNVKESYVPHGGVPSDLEMPDPSVDENSNGSRIGNIGNILHNMSCSMADENEQSEFGGYASFCWELGVKLKQDAIKLPLVNWDGKQSFDFGMAYIDGSGTKCEFLGLHAGIVIGRPVIAIGLPTHNKYYVSTSDKSFCKPIQTDEEKLRDEICRLLDKASHLTPFNTPYVLTMLLASDKFTIKLKG